MARKTTPQQRRNRALAALKDTKTMFWMDRFIRCVVLGERIRLDMAEQAKTIGASAVTNQYTDAQLDFEASTDPRYPYAQNWSSREEFDHFWMKCEENMRRGYPETLYDKCMTFLVCTFGVQFIPGIEWGEHPSRDILVGYGSSESVDIMRSQGFFAPLGDIDAIFAFQFPKNPYAHLGKWLDKSFTFTEIDRSGSDRGPKTTTYTVESVSRPEVATTTDDDAQGQDQDRAPKYALRGPGGTSREVSEAELHWMVMCRPIP